VAYSARLDLDTDLRRTRFWNISVYDFESAFGLRDLYRAHILLTNYSYLGDSVAAPFGD
jgi:hypothetical protein